MAGKLRANLGCACPCGAPAIDERGDVDNGPVSFHRSGVAIGRVRFTLHQRVVAGKAELEGKATIRLQFGNRDDVLWTS